MRPTGLRAGAAALLVAGLAAIAGMTFVGERKANAPAAATPAAPPAGKQPTLMLLTTLPLVFAEKFGLDNAGSPALGALETRYTVRPIAVTDAATLSQARLLLMAHPLALPAEALVDLDRWVRRGGRLLLLADPALDWHSELPLGDALRPPPAFADTGLLKHWG
ncbi:MAG: ABC transporter, partial [Sphingomonas sp.]|nr:ABC transporter [Sphingomonas sp.]